MLGSTQISVAQVRLERDGIALRVPRGGAIHDASDVGGRETYLRYRGGRLILRLIRGGEYAADPSGVTGRPTRACGRPARRFELALARTVAHGAYLDAEGIVRHTEPSITPATVLVIVTLALADGARVRIDWQVRTEHRARLRERERAFFGSIRCR